MAEPFDALTAAFGHAKMKRILAVLTEAKYGFISHEAMADLASLRKESDIAELRAALLKMHDAARAYWDGDDEDGGPLIKTLAETRQILKT